MQTPAIRDEQGRFTPGHSGNPAGRPKNGLTAMLNAAMSTDAGDGATWAEVIRDKLLSLAASGNVEALKYLADRLEGRPAQALHLSADAGGPLHYRLNVIDSGPRQRALPPGANGATE